MIPKNITRNHIVDAINEVDNKGIPDNRHSTKYILVFKGRIYPPKYIISIANKYANAEMLDSELFSGGKESNSFLHELGFTIYTKERPLPVPRKKKATKKITTRIKHKHTERCPNCKRIIEEMLAKIYGEVRGNYKFNVGVRPSDYNESAYYKEIKIIFESLQKFRGYHDFIKSRNLPHVDYFVPDPGFIVEFDESQHFTICRKEALTAYPDELVLGFSREKWINLCDRIESKDNDPAYRDEQRAWYDTLRDFLPTIENLQPTIRLYSKDFQWCKLNPELPADINKFKSLLAGNKTWNDIGIRKDANPTMGRIVIAGEWVGITETASFLLNKICDVWPEGKRIDFLITCGAFLNFKWPSEIRSVQNNIYPNTEILDHLKSIAKEQCKLLLDDKLRKRLKNYTDYITVGIDSFKDKVSVSQAVIRQPHAEMVALVDLKSNKIFITGKSYPTTGQENGLVRFDDISSHFVSTSKGKVMLLGCHDLNVFSPRGEAATKKEWRRKVRRDFYKSLKKEKPNIVLHHPHTTDSSKIWTSAWNELAGSSLTEVRYLSAGRHYNPEGER
ncbi:MAG: hypothetical protein ACP5E3_18425, partial [Bacteroidales bacterium]